MTVSAAPKPGGTRAVGSPQISVICTARNAAGTIDRTIRSILAQDFQDWEMIVVDDGSTDATASIVGSFAAADPRLRLVATAGLGRGSALNRAVAEARADLVANLDADDESHPQRLGRQLEVVRRQPEFAILYTEFIRVEGAAEPVWPVLDASAAATAADMTAGLASRNPVCHSSVMLRKSTIVGLGGYDEARRASFDYDLWVRCVSAGLRLGRIPLPLVAKRIHPGQLYARSRRFSRAVASAQVQLQAMRVLGVGKQHLPVVGLRFLWACLPPGAQAALRRLSGGRRLGRPTG